MKIMKVMLMMTSMCMQWIVMMMMMLVMMTSMCMQWIVMMMMLVMMTSMCMQWIVMMATTLRPAVPTAKPALTRALGRNCTKSVNM